VILLKEILKNTKYIVYCDLDSVLADFDNMFVSIAGVNIKDGWSFKKKYGEEKFWNIISNYGIKFWTDMPWMSDGRQLWKYIISTFSKINILSSVPEDDTAHSRQGKIVWCKRNLGNVNVILEKNKYRYVSKNSILIDDLEKNINPWVSSGGIGILHKSTGNTISKLEK